MLWWVFRGTNDGSKTVFKGVPCVSHSISPSIFNCFSLCQKKKKKKTESEKTKLVSRHAARTWSLSLSLSLMSSSFSMLSIKQQSRVASCRHISNLLRVHNILYSVKTVNVSYFSCVSFKKGEKDEQTVAAFLRWQLCLVHSRGALSCNLNLRCTFSVIGIKSVVFKKNKKNIKVLPLTVKF